MRKLILLAATISLGFAASAQNGIVRTTNPDRIDDQPIRAEDQTFTAVEQMPEFPGGIAALTQFLNTNIHYPETARKNNVEGRVIVKFVVTRGGKIANAKVMRDIGSGCGEEALRVVNAMPDWRPGKQNGMAVNVYYTLPISFKLSDPEPAKTKENK
jgi:TonB family protein